MAGKRAGIGGERSGLFHEMTRIINELKPVYAVWENVPGLDTSFSPVEPSPEPVEGGMWDVEEDNDFETVLRAFRDIGYFGAGRVFDAEYFGLAQRRERWFGVFARGDIRAGRCAEILSIAEGMCWHPAPRRKTGQGIAATLESRADGGGFPGTDGACGGHVVPTMSSKWAKGTGGPSGDEAQNLVAVAACSPPITSNQYGDHESREGLLVAHTLRAEGFDASEDGTRRGTPIVPVAFSCKNSGNVGAGEISPTLRLMGHDGSHMNGGGHLAVCYENHGQDSRVKDCGDLSPTIHAKAGTGGNNLPLVAFQQNASGEVRQGDVAYTLNQNSNASGRNTGMVATRMMVRRLTPRECERLQGFPDDWTATDAEGKHISDSARYRMLGNAVAVPVARWIGERMKRIHMEESV